MLEGIFKFYFNSILDIENSKVSVFATVIFAFIGYYIMVCAMKGNVRIGMRFFCITFYPLR